MKLIMANDAVEQDRGKWHDLRRNGITASEIAGIMGVPGAYKPAVSIYWDKVSPGPDESSLLMRKGTHDEAFIAGELARDGEFPPLFDGGLYAHDDRDWQMSTFDRLTYERITNPAGLGDPGLFAGRPVPVQMKTSTDRDAWGDTPYGDIPPQYLAQVMWEIATADAAYGLLPCLIQPFGPIKVYRVDRDDDDIAAMIAEAERFLDRIATRTPPPPDGSEQAARTLKRVHADLVDEVVLIPRGMAARLRAAKRSLDKAQKRFDLASNTVRARIGPATTAAILAGPDGKFDVVARHSISPVKEHVRKASVRDSLTVKFPKAEQ